VKVGTVVDRSRLPSCPRPRRGPPWRGPAP
jgi:hypothetical protein